MFRLVSKVLFIVVLSALVLSPAVGAAGKEPYKIGAFLSVTGPNAPLGTPEKETLLMLAEKVNKSGGINGHPIQVIIEDDASDPTTAVKAAKKLVEQDKVCAIIGGSGTGPTMAVISAVTDTSKIPHIACAAGIAITNPLNKWVFRTAPTDIVAAGRLLSYFKKHNIAKIAVIYDSNAFGVSGRDQLRNLAPNSGVTIVDEESFGSKDTDMTVQLTKIRSTDAQAIVCWGTNPGPAQVTKNIRQLGITLPIFQSHGVANQEFIELSQGMAEGVIFPAGKITVAEQLPAGDPQRKVLIQYVKDFKAKFNKPAVTFGGHTWDAFWMITGALKKVGNDPSKIRDQIEGLRNFRGIGGVFNFSPTDHDGLGNDAYVMITVKNGKFKLLK